MMLCKVFLFECVFVYFYGWFYIVGGFDIKGLFS